MINAGYPITFHYMVVQVYIIVISVQTIPESKLNPSFNITNLSHLFWWCHFLLLTWAICSDDITSCYSFNITNLCHLFWWYHFLLLTWAICSDDITSCYSFNITNLCHLLWWCHFRLLTWAICSDAVTSCYRLYITNLTLLFWWCHSLLMYIHTSWEIQNHMQWIQLKNNEKEKRKIW